MRSVFEPFHEINVFSSILQDECSHVSDAQEVQGQETAGNARGGIQGTRFHSRLEVRLGGIKLVNHVTIRVYYQ